MSHTFEIKSSSRSLFFMLCYYIMKIAVPSYNRVSIFKTKTLRILLENSVDINDIYLFVANQEQYDLYKPAMPDALKIIIGEKGMCNVRNFMTDYFDDGDVIVYMDDDIEKVKQKNNKTFLDALTECCKYLETSTYNLIGLPPTWNDFFNKDNGFKSGLLVAIGCFYIMRNDKSIKVDNVIVEDLQRTILCYLKYGGTYRYCDLMVKTKPFADGGVNDADGRNYTGYYNAVVRLFYQYPSLINLSTKKIKYISAEEVPHIRFKSLKNKVDLIQPKVIELPKVQQSLFEPLLKLLNETKLSIKQDEESAKKVNGTFRKNFPKHRANIFGVVKLRSVNGGGCAISKCSEQKPKIYEELKRIGNTIVPFKYSSILVNHNTVCGKHLDANNVGQSCIVSIGDYSGCNLMIEEKQYNAHYQPLIFNGSEMEHYNTDDLVGNKYSLVFYYIKNDIN